MSTYAIASLLRTGTFTTGISADWWTQFYGAPQYMAVPSMAGELVFGASTAGICLYVTFIANNPFDAVVDFEASVGAPLQIYVNPLTNGAVPTLEVTVSGTQTLSFPQGYNAYACIRAAGPIIATPQGVLFDPLGKTGMWVSPFYPGSDPFVDSGGTGGLVGSDGTKAVLPGP